MNGLNEYELIAFIKSQFKSFDKNISDYDAKYMLDKIGYDMNTICNECAKTASFSGTDNTITKNHIIFVKLIFKNGVLF